MEDETIRAVGLKQHTKADTGEFLYVLYSDAKCFCVLKCSMQEFSENLQQRLYFMYFMLLL